PPQGRASTISHRPGVRRHEMGANATVRLQIDEIRRDQKEARTTINEDFTEPHSPVATDEQPCRADEGANEKAVIVPKEQACDCDGGNCQASWPCRTIDQRPCGRHD